VGFAGFGAGLVGLYDGLAADNSRAYWLAHKEVYERDVAAPLRALADALEPDFGEAKLFRPHRDVRFSPDKRPYQEHASLAVLGAGAGLYVQISPDGLMLAGGAWRPARDQLDRFRRAVDDEVVAAELDRTLARLARAARVVAGAPAHRPAASAQSDGEPPARPGAVVAHLRAARRRPRRLAPRRGGEQLVARPRRSLHRAARSVRPQAAMSACSSSLPTAPSRGGTRVAASSARTLVAVFPDRLL